MADSDERRGEGSGANREDRCGDGRGDGTPATGVKDEAADCDRGRGSTARSGDVAGDWPGLAAVLVSFASLIGIVAVSMRAVKRRDGCGVTNTESPAPPTTPPPSAVTDMASAEMRYVPQWASLLPPSVSSHRDSTSITLKAQSARRGVVVRWLG